MKKEFQTSEIGSHVILNVFITLSVLFTTVSISTMAFSNGVEKNQDIDLSEAEKVNTLFDDAGAIGTFVLIHQDGTVQTVYNQSRARKRFSPASTFKILNTLIALDSGLIDSVNSVFKWDGKERLLESWNKDQTLASAFKLSCVWCYQQLANSLDLETYLNELRNIGYGNQSVGTEVDQFWLDGSLTISAFEQVEFLAALINNELPYKKRHLDILKSIMYEASYGNGATKLYGKTGWAAGDLNVGWYVGFVESQGQTSVFALNMVLDNMDDAPLRKHLALESLITLGLLPRQ